jgi:WD40 repeat protein
LTIPHVGNVNRIRAAPVPSGSAVPDPYHVATFSETGKVHIFDVKPYIDTLSGPSKPRQKLPVHTISNHGRSEGFAIEWGNTGLLTGDVDKKIFLTTVTPTGFHTSPNPYLSHTSSVEDLQWSPNESTVFASCSADRTVRVWDIRAKGRKSVVSVEAHDEDVNVISWNKGVDYLLLSGGDEGGLKVWDLRMFKEYVHTAAKQVTQLIQIGRHPPLPTFHGILHLSLPSNGIHPTHPSSQPPVPMTRSHSGIFPSSRTKTKHLSFNPPQILKSPHNCSLSTKDRRMSRSCIGTLRSPVCCSRPPPTRSMLSKRYRYS